MIKYELIIRILLTLTVVSVPLVYIAKRYTSSMKRVFTVLSQLHKQSSQKKQEDDMNETISEPEASLSSEPDRSESPDIAPQESEEITIAIETIEITSDESNPEELQEEIQEQEEKLENNDIDTTETETETEIIIEEYSEEIVIIDDTAVQTETIDLENTTEKETSSLAEDTLTDQQPLKEESLSSIQPEKLQQTLETIKYSALTHKERGKLDMYEKKLIEGLALQPENKDFLKLLSNHYFEQGNYVKALTLLKKLINDDPTNHKAIRQIGQIYREQGDLEAARLLIEKAISLKDDNPTYLISMVEIHYENKEIRDAIKIMERLIKIRPTNIDYLLTLATLHEEISEPTKAMAYYMKTLEFDPLNDHAKTAIRRLNA